MAFFSQATLEQIRGASDIVDVIGGYVPLKRAGANFVALCPFHKEKTPSFNVNPHRQIFRCFGCNKGGDVFTFVKEYESIDFIEAVRRLAERARIPLEYEQNAGEQQSRHIKEKLLQIHEQITQRWQMALANDAAGQIARDYLAKRGVSAEAVKLFRLGYAPDLWDDTVNWARSKEFETDLVEKAGLIIRREGSEGHYDRFRGRLMFPICDEQGRVVEFSGRVLSGDEKTAKYVNSPETPIFTKSKICFGLDKSKRALLDVGSAIVCEGQLDLIACFMAGVQNVVAPQGTAFTGDHARILKRYVDEIVLCFDSDDAGQNAAVRALDHLLASGLAVRVAVVPAPHDPDSFIKAFGGPAFKELIDQAKGFFDYYLNRLCSTNDVSQDKGRLAVLRAMGEALQKTQSKLLIEQYSQQTAHRLGIYVGGVHGEFSKLLKASFKGQPGDVESVEGQADDVELKPIPPREHWLLRLVLTNDDLVPWAADRLDLNWLQHATVRRVVEARIAALKTDSWCGVAGFLDQFQDDASRNLITEIVVEKHQIPEPEKTLKGDPTWGDKRGILEQLREEFIERQLAALRVRVNQPQTTEEEQIELLRQQQALREMKRKPLGVIPKI